MANTNLMEILLSHDGCRPIVYGASASGKPILGIVTPDGRYVVAKGETVEVCLRALCEHRRISVEPPPPPAAVSEVTADQWQRFLSGHGPWT